MWTEKYRPRRLDEVVGQEETVAELRAYLRAGEIPHLMFVGPPATGKTTLAYVLARELNGEGWEADFLELNASNDRGIETIRGRLLTFLRARPWGRFRILLLDEAEGLTGEAQQALRRPLETAAAGRCRFIFTANDVWGFQQWHPALQSRCRTFRFHPLEAEAMLTRLRQIAQAEGLPLDERVLRAAAVTAKGDLRQAMMRLEAVAAEGALA